MRWVFCVVALGVLLVGNLRAEHDPADEKPAVNMLVPSDYFADGAIKKYVEQTVGVNVYCDVYNSCEEFLHRWAKEKNNYHIIIFPHVLHEILRKDLDDCTVNITGLTKDYLPYLQREYLRKKYTSNVVYFSHFVAGVLYDDSALTVTQSDALDVIFKKIDNKRVAISNEPIDVCEWMCRGAGGPNISKYMLFSADNFLSMVQNAQVFITHNCYRLYHKVPFVCALTQSDYGMLCQRQNPHFKFIVHDKLSYLESYLLAVVDDRPYLSDVAVALTNKNVGDMLQSLYGAFAANFQKYEKADVQLEYLRQYVEAHLDGLTWVDPVDFSTLRQLQYRWKMTRFAVEALKHENTSVMSRTMAHAVAASMADFMQEGDSLERRIHSTISRLFGEVDLTRKKVLIFYEDRLLPTIIYMVQHYGADVTVIHTNELILRQVKSKLNVHKKDVRGSFTTLFVPDLTKLPLGDATVDLTGARELLARMMPDVAVFKEIHRVLKDKGMFALEAWCRTNKTPDWDYKDEFSSSQLLTNTVKKSGFANVTVTDTSARIQRSLQKHLDHLTGRYAQPMRAKFGNEWYVANYDRITHLLHGIQKEALQVLVWRAVK